VDLPVEAWWPATATAAMVPLLVGFLGDRVRDAAMPRRRK
jgi:hypothetical protein